MVWPAQATLAPATQLDQLYDQLGHAGLKAHTQLDQLKFEADQAGHKLYFTAGQTFIVL